MLMLELPWSTFTLPKIPGEVGTIIIFLVLLTRTPKLNSQGTSSPRSHNLGTAETRQSSLFLTLGGGAPAHAALNTTFLHHCPDLRTFSLESRETTEGLGRHRSGSG